MSAPQTWRRFSLVVRPADADLASALLGAASGSATVVEAPGEDAPLNAPLRVSAFVHSSKAKAAERRVSSAYARSRRDGVLRGSRLCAAANVRDEDWAESWKRFYTPFAIVPGWWVVPSWEEGFRAPRRARILWMDPGMAFGTGQHPTTVSALRLLLPRVRSGGKLLDIGCGSGILGIAAAMKGARVYACDIDPVAVDAARSNFRANGVKPASLIRAGAVPSAFGRAPLVVANITADALTASAAKLARGLTRGGTIITSGVTKRGRDGVLAAFSSCGLRLCAERRSGEWLAFAHEKA